MSCSSSLGHQVSDFSIRKRQGRVASIPGCCIDLHNVVVVVEGGRGGRKGERSATDNKLPTEKNSNTASGVHTQGVWTVSPRPCSTPQSASDDSEGQEPLCPQASGMKAPLEERARTTLAPGCTSLGLLADTHTRAHTRTHTHTYTHCQSSRTQKHKEALH